MIYIHTTGIDNKPYKLQIRAEIITAWQLIGNIIVIEFKGTAIQGATIKKTITHEWTWQKPTDQITNWPEVHMFLISLNFKALKKLSNPLPIQESLF